MKKTFLILLGVGIIIVITLFVVGPSIFSNTIKVDAQTSKYTDRLNGYSFLYPSSFKFTKDTGGMTIISNSVNGVQLMFAFRNSDYVDICTSEEKFISKPLNIPGETYSKEVVGQDVVYKYYKLDNASSSSNFARYSIVHGDRCLTISERNIIQDFSILDSILSSVTFK